MAAFTGFGGLLLYLAYEVVTEFIHGLLLGHSGGFVGGLGSGLLLQGLLGLVDLAYVVALVILLVVALPGAVIFLPRALVNL